MKPLPPRRRPLAGGGDRRGGMVTRRPEETSLCSGGSVGPASGTGSFAHHTRVPPLSPRGVWAARAPSLRGRRLGVPPPAVPAWGPGSGPGSGVALSQTAEGTGPSAAHTRNASLAATCTSLFATGETHCAFFFFALLV